MLRHIRKLFKYFKQSTSPSNSSNEDSSYSPLQNIEEREESEQVDISTDEKILLSNIIQIRGLTASNIMQQREEIPALNMDATFDQIVEFLEQNKKTSVIIYRDNLDDVNGIVHMTDLMKYFHKTEEFELKKVMSEVLFVAPSIRIFELIIKMWNARTDNALIVDEFGGIDGIVTMHDIIENIVGRLQDSQVINGDPTIEVRHDGTYIVDARVELDELQKRIGPLTRNFNLDEDIETLGGFLTAYVGRVPSRGELIVVPSGFEFEVKDADPRRIKKVLIRYDTMYNQEKLIGGKKSRSSKVKK